MPASPAFSSLNPGRHTSHTDQVINEQLLSETGVGSVPYTGVVLVHSWSKSIVLSLRKFCDLMPLTEDAISERKTTAQREVRDPLP